MKKFIYHLFGKCQHDWGPATIRQVRVENGQLIPFKTKTHLLLECSKCGKTKRTL